MISKVSLWLNSGIKKQRWGDCKLNSCFPNGVHGDDKSASMDFKLRDILNELKNSIPALEFRNAGMLTFSRVFVNQFTILLVVSGQWSVVSGQWSVVSGQWSVVSGQWSVVSVSCLSSVVNLMPACHYAVQKDVGSASQKFTQPNN
jgi:hypothetical protein